MIYDRNNLPPDYENVLVDQIVKLNNLFENFQSRLFHENGTLDHATLAHGLRAQSQCRASIATLKQIQALRNRT